MVVRGVYDGFAASTVREGSLAVFGKVWGGLGKVLQKGEMEVDSGRLLEGWLIDCRVE